MSSKENAAIYLLFEKLECRYALRVLWSCATATPNLPPAARQCGRHHAQHAQHAHQRAARSGLLDHGSDGYTVTPTGQDLLKRLSDL